MISIATLLSKPVLAYTCNSIDSSDSSTCSGTGSCIQNETCLCLDGYSGTYCEYVECFGTSTEPGNMVCSGHGSCVSIDSCQCDGGYYGSTCSDTTCYGKWSNSSSSLDYCSGHGNCTALDTCECRAGYLGDECEKDLFAGYKLISTSPIVIAKNSLANSQLMASIAVPSMILSSAYSLDGSTPLPYIISNTSSTVITDTTNDPFGQLLAQEADRKGSELYNLPCDHIINGSQELGKVIIVRNGGVYCFPNGISINNHIFVIIGTETVLFRSPFVYYYGATFYYLECASYRNVFWLTYDKGDEGNFFSGNIHGTVIAASPYHGIQLYNNLLGAVWSIGGTDIIMFDVQISPPITFNQNESWIHEDCLETYCFGILSSLTNTTCFGRGLCVKNDTCLCNDDSYGNECTISKCNGILGNETSLVCSGHGSCHSKDTCECDSGYFGSWCELTTCLSVQSDSPTVCNGRGQCAQLDTCVCDTSYGYGGYYCEIPICHGIHGNESTVCLSKGQCTHPDTCQCQSNYMGENCQITTCFGILSNESSTCSGNGSCIETDQCSCSQGYYGANCSDFDCFGIDYLNGSVCSGRGQCVNLNQCQCLPAYSGTQCNISMCYGISGSDPQVCNGKGVCSDTDTCGCYQNYSGSFCNETSCSGVINSDPLVCSGQGSCWPFETCSCLSSYGGLDCELPKCFSILSSNISVCSGRGSCMLSDICNCSQNYQGSECELTTCGGILSNESQLVCSGRGKCSDLDTCQCIAPYYGSDCENFDCYGVSKFLNSSCSGHGHCVGLDTCLCDTDYYGNNCNVTICNGSFSNTTNIVCSSKGSCLAPNTCQCQENHVGQWCDVTSCNNVYSNDSNTCSGHGACVDFNTCQCTLDYSGSFCQNPILDPFAGFRLISNAAVSISIDYFLTDWQPVLHSYNRYYSASLVLKSITTVDANTIYLPHSNATILNSTTGQGLQILNRMEKLKSDILKASQTCSKTYTNSDSPSTFIIKHGGVICFTGGMTFGPEVTITIIGTEPVIFKLPSLQYNALNIIYLECATYRNFFWVLSSSSFIKGGDHTTNFLPAIHGTFVQLSGTFSMRGHLAGSIWASGVSSILLHEVTFYEPSTFDPLENFVDPLSNYTLCYNIKSTDASVCSGRGKCTDYNTCVCQHASFGSACSRYTCDGISSTNTSSVCHGRGKCLGPDLCACNSTYYGNFCELTTCNDIENTSPSVCNGRGSCNHFNSCSCFGYGGSDCEIHICFDILANSQSVCSSRGECLAPNLCSCNETYFGSACELTTCNGIQSNNSKVCSSHGTCVSFETCSCNTGFYGQSCENYGCNGVNFQDSSTCSGRGNCTAPDNCTCITGYYGSYCQQTKCNNVLSDDATVCSSHGNCTAPDTCICEDFYSGTYCSETSCNGTFSNSSLACNGGGVCWPFDTCTCYSDLSREYQGTWCERRLWDPFAGFRIITPNYVVYHLDYNSNFFQPHINSYDRFFASSIILDQLTLITPGTNYTGINGAQIISSHSAQGDQLTKLARKKRDLMYAPCTKHISSPTDLPWISSNEILIRHGAVLCFDYEAFFDMATTIVIIGPEPVLFLVPSLLYNSVNFVFAECASYRNFFWVVTSYNPSYIQGGNRDTGYEPPIHGTFVPLFSGSLQFSGPFAGSIWATGNAGTVLVEVTIHPPLSIDPYEPTVGPFCNYTQCYKVQSNLNTTCHGRGQCIDYNKCICNEDAFGADCSISKCNGTLGNLSTVCGGHGSCVAKDECVCNTGYYGEWCQFTTCAGIENTSPLACRERGVCVAFNQCSCNLTHGYGGSDCEIPYCNNVLGNLSSVCNGHGACSLPNVCNCSDNYFGSNCQYTSCAGVQSNDISVCSGKGQCKTYNNCTCTSPYYGTNCEQFDCFGYNRNSGSVCTGRGNCTNYNTCVCAEGYQGTSCSVSTCFGILSTSATVCQGHGSCIATNTCVCAANYGSSDCSLTQCSGINSTSPSVCSGRGKCWPYNTCTCNANLGYGGTQCNEPLCAGYLNSNPRVCNMNKGTCVSPNVCSCFEKNKYFGSFCEHTYCDGFPSNSHDRQYCSGNGYCFDYNQCVCFGGYSGAKCQNDLFAGFAFLTNKNVYIMQNQILLLNASVGAGPLTNPGQATFIPNGQAVNVDLPVDPLMNEFRLKMLDMDLPCDRHIKDAAIELGRDIVIRSGGVFCFNKPWTLDGQTFTIIGKKRTVFKLPYIRYYSANFIYRECASYRDVIFYTYERSGNSKFSGTLDGTIMVNANALSANYIVDGPILGAVYIYGDESNGPPYGTVYLSNTSFTEPYTFNPTVRYIESKCNYFTCFNISSNLNTTCSGRGACVDTDTCTCNGAYGADCSISVCNGTLGNYSGVCSGHGSCISSDICKCRAGFYGNWCQYTTCFTLENTSPSVCSGRGSCISQDNCSCYPLLGYGGSRCDIPICGNLLGTCTVTSRGNCTAPDTCSCENHYFGQFCQSTTCYNVPSNSSSVCSGRGICSSYNNCQCKAGFIGSRCDRDVFAGYKLISNKPVLLAKNSRPSSILLGSISLPSMTIRPPTFLNPDKVYPYVASGKAFISKPTDVNYGVLMTELAKKFDELVSTPCNYIISNPDTEMGQKIVIEHGGVYCFKNGWTVNGQKIVIVGTEPVIFKAPFVKYSGANFVYLKCATYRNVFWLTQYYNLTDSLNWVYSSSFSGTVHGTVVARYGYDYLISGDIQGAIWFYTQEDSYITLKDAKLSAPQTFDPYLPYITGACDTYTCFDIDPTSNMSCSGRGVCMDYNTCICQENSFGADCSISVCNETFGNVSTVCNSHGSCTDKDTCTCKEGYNGLWCQYTTCSGILNTSPNVCNKRGVCSSYNSCTCNTTFGYGGSNCDIPICNYIVGSCTESYRGNCTSPNTCACENHYYGHYCELTTCGGIESTNSQVCSRRGNCSAFDTCTCDYGYTGMLCEEHTCFGVTSTLPSTCSGRGSCIGVDECLCNANYYGANCEISKCGGVFGNESSVCSSNGQCIDTNVCNCSENYHGNWCQFTTCGGVESINASTCAGRGQCIGFDTCSCNNHYFGENCELTTCDSKVSNSSLVCNLVGECTDYNTCICPYGYTGSWCQLTTCFGIATGLPNVCNGRGNCSIMDFCTCDLSLGYGGSNCNIQMCGGIIYNSTKVCNSHGSCVAPNVCQCAPHYIGDTCEVTTCFGILYNDSTVCSRRGICDGYNNCTCQVGYSGIDCSEFTCSSVLNSDPNVCSGRGNCTDYDICECEADSFDFDCSGVICNGFISADPLVCNSHGFCIDNQVCNCTENYHGEWCQFTNCNGTDSNSTQACNGRGSCIDFNTCVCNTGYYGNDCQDYNCFGTPQYSDQVCSGNGNCTGIDTCRCFDDSLGIECSINVCGGIPMNSTLVCSGHGNCTEPSYCNCTDKYFGGSCEWTTCYSIASFSPSVCSGRGNCSDFDSCLCNSDAFGQDCSLFKCNNTLSNHGSVCSGRGLCIDTNVCNCSDHYYGENCKVTECFSILSNESSVCSGRGDCIEFDNCVCKSGYFGIDCSQFQCNDTFNNDTRVCSGRGECIDSNVCNCSEHSFGRNCELFQCFSILSNESSVCSGRGECIEYQNCSCNNGFFGDNCENVFTNNSNTANSTQINNQSIICESCNITLSNGTNNQSIVTNETILESNNTHASNNNTTISNNTSIDNTTLSNSTTPISNITIQNNTVPVVDPVPNSNITSSQNESMIKNSTFEKTNNSSVNNGSVVDISSNKTSTSNSTTNSNTTNIEPVVTLPVAVIKILGSNVFSSCEEIGIDGSESRSPGGSLLDYYWSLLDASSMQIILQSFANSPIITLGSSLQPGQYVMSLRVYSSTLGKYSTTIYSQYFTKSSNPLPKLYIANPLVEKYGTQFPISIKKVITESSCQQEKSVIVWTKLSGPSIKFNVDSFYNIYIPSLLTYGFHTYVFQVSAYYPSNPLEKVSSNVTLITKSPDLQLTLLQTETTSNYSIIGVDYKDPESAYDHLPEDWKWTCLNNTNPNLLSFLDLVSRSKLTEIQVDSSLFDNNIPPSIELVLRISKSNGRTIFKSTIVYFGSVPPVVNIIAVEPSSVYILPGEPLTIQTLISNDNANLTVMLNEKVIELTGHSTLEIDTTNLSPGSNNTITITSTDPITGATSSTSYTFKVATYPKPCNCVINPDMGTALATDFEFYCTNCRDSESNIDYRYGFIDDRSGTKILLFNKGEVYATKLPALFSGTNVRCFFDIVDTETGAYTTVFKNVTLEKPIVTQVEQVQGLVEVWAATGSNYYQAGDFSKSIYQCASTSRTDSVLLRQILGTEFSERSYYSVECINGVDIAGVCKCHDGYIGRYCDKSITDFSNIQETKLKVLREMMGVANSSEGEVNQEYLSLLSFAIDSMLFNYPYLDTNTISESLYTLNMFLEYALSDPSIRLPSGVDSLLESSQDSAYNYIADKQYLTNQTSNSLKLLKSLKLSSRLQARSVSTGSKHIKGNFFSLVLGKGLLSDHQNLVKDPATSAFITLGDKFFVYNSVRSKVSSVNKPYMYIFTVTDDIYSLNTMLKVVDKHKNTNQASSLISPIVSIDFVDVPTSMDANELIYTIPINPNGSTFEISTGVFDLKVKTLDQSCGNFDEGSIRILSDCRLLSYSNTYAKCQCMKITNVFVVQTTTITTYSYTYLAAISFSIVAVGSILALFAIFICVWCKLKKPKIKRKGLVRDAPENSIQLRVQEIILGYPTNDNNSEADDPSLLIDITDDCTTASSSQSGQPLRGRMRSYSLQERPTTMMVVSSSPPREHIGVAARAIGTRNRSSSVAPLIEEHYEIDSNTSSNDELLKTTVKRSDSGVWDLREDGFVE